MKLKYTTLVFAIMLFLVILSSCSEGEINEINQNEPISEVISEQSEDSTTTLTNDVDVDLTEEPLKPVDKLEKEPPIPIKIESPMTIARSHVSIDETYSYLDISLSLQLVRGKYTEDWNPGPFMGRNWDGTFAFVLSDHSGEVISETKVNPFFNNAGLTFNSFFDFQFDDYNNDGNVDFTVEQYGSSNGNLVRLFTIKNNVVELLPIKDYEELFISGHLEKVDETTFKKTLYNNMDGTYNIDYFTWDGTQFILREMN